MNKRNYTDLLHASADTLGVLLDEKQQRQLLAYLEGMLLWNKAYNLTAIKDANEALVKHIIDCLAIVPAFERECERHHYKESITVLDIGTGAGLPAVVLAIMNSSLLVTALDSNQKKIRFIRQMASELKLPNLIPIASRIESHQGVYDIITSRAFANLSDFVAYAQPFLADEGALCAMKGKLPDVDELSVLVDNWHIINESIVVPNLTAERCLVHLTKK